MWDIEYFTWSSGRCPVKDFINALHPIKDQPYVFESFRRLAIEGNKLQIPFSKPLGDGLFELTVQTETLKLRFFYFFHEKNIIIITNGAKKKSWRLKDDIKKARDYRSKYLESVRK